MAGRRSKVKRKVIKWLMACDGVWTERDQELRQRRRAREARQIRQRKGAAEAGAEEEKQQQRDRRGRGRRRRCDACCQELREREGREREVRQRQREADVMPVHTFLRPLGSRDAAAPSTLDFCHGAALPPQLMAMQGANNAVCQLIEPTLQRPRAMRRASLAISAN
ncbi:hypothetical protein E4U16_007032 [Claviceps sp. LM84 group G4]|nr:hypothetical protein E4U16_007032 [Claviceps sp. LM84 group G4]